VQNALRDTIVVPPMEHADQSLAPIDDPHAAAPRSPHEALERLLAAVRPTATERVTLGDARGRILAERCVADRPSPAIDVSAMDGFAVRLDDALRGPLPIAGDAAIGDAPPTLPRGAALRIVTGAAIPHGADTIIKREDLLEQDGSIAARTERPTWRVGDNIRRCGENMAAGAVIIEPGAALTAPRVGALATIGAHAPLVHRRLRIAILTTGDELLPPDTPALPAWRLRDSNGPALRAMFEHRGWVESVSQTRVADDEERMRDAIAAALAACDALLLTGGVSMGHRDLVPSTLASLGVRTLFHRLPQRPGKPLLAGVTADGRPVLGLPGNPVSVLVTARRFAWPALRQRAGMVSEANGGPDAIVEFANADERTIPLWWHRLVRLASPGRALLTDVRSSGDILGAAGSCGFVEIPPDRSGPGPWPFFRWPE
jgi:molybdopterin molybdotransferase